MTLCLAGWLGSSVVFPLGTAECWAKTTVDGRQVGSKARSGLGTCSNLAGVSLGS